MHRSKGRRRSAARIVGWGLVAIAYATVLVWAGGLTGGVAGPGEVSQPAAGAITVAAREVGGELATVAAIETPAEAPLVTLGVAAGMVVLAGTAYAIHAFRARARRPRLPRAARLVVRHITTLQ